GPGGVLLPALPQAAGAVRPVPRQAAQRERLPLGRGSGEADGPPSHRRGRLAAELHRLDQIRGRGGRRDQGGAARAGPLSLEPRGVGRAVRPGDDRGAALRHPGARHPPRRAAGADHAAGGRAVRHRGGDDRRGRLAIDDHHVLVDAADRLVSGLGLEVEHKRSILYPGVVALIMRVTRAVDDPSPATQLLVVRLVQAAYSLFTVLLVYRILERTATPRTALLGGLLVATFFALPITAVHQFEEAVCQVPLLASCWWLLRAREGPRGGTFALLAGTALGVALIVRFPLISFVVPFALLALWQDPDRRRGALFLAGLALVLTLQGLSNHLINHEWWYSFRIYYGPLVHWPPRILTDPGGYPQGAVWTYAAALP